MADDFNPDPRFYRLTIPTAQIDCSVSRPGPYLFQSAARYDKIISVVNSASKFANLFDTIFLCLSSPPRQHLNFSSS